MSDDGITIRVRGYLPPPPPRYYVKLGELVIAIYQWNYTTEKWDFYTPEDK